MVDQIAAQQYEVGPGIERVHMGDGCRKHGVGIGDTLIEHAFGAAHAGSDSCAISI